jgi:glutamine synthetase
MQKVDEILNYFGIKNVKFVRPFFVDILGRQLDFTLPISGFEDFVKNGKGFDGSSVEGFARTEESDLLFVPDLSTLCILPWDYVDEKNSLNWREAIVFGNIYNTDKSRNPSDTRALLEDVLKKNADYGELKCGAELELPSHTDAGGYFRAGNYGELRKGVQLMLNKMGIKT